MIFCFFLHNFVLAILATSNIRVKSHSISKNFFYRYLLVGTQTGYGTRKDKKIQSFADLLHSPLCFNTTMNYLCVKSWATLFLLPFLSSLSYSSFSSSGGLGPRPESMGIALSVKTTGMFPIIRSMVTRKSTLLGLMSRLSGSKSKGSV